MRTIVWLSLALPACWAGEPAAPSTTAASGTPSPRAPQHRVPSRRVEPALDRRDPFVLTRALRAEPRRALESDGPIVFYDFDTGAVETLCDANAHDAETTWSALLADPARAAPLCRMSWTTIECKQDTDKPILLVHYSAATGRPIIVMSGEANVARGNVTADTLWQAAQTARCP